MFCYGFKRRWFQDYQVYLRCIFSFENSEEQVNCADEDSCEGEALSLTNSFYQQRHVGYLPGMPRHWLRFAWDIRLSTDWRRGPDI